MHYYLEAYQGTRRIERLSSEDVDVHELINVLSWYQDDPGIASITIVISAELVTKGERDDDHEE